MSGNVCDGSTEGIRLSMGSSYNKIFDNQVLNTTERELTIVGRHTHNTPDLEVGENSELKPKNDDIVRERMLFMLLHERIALLFEILWSSGMSNGCCSGREFFSPGGVNTGHAERLHASTGAGFVTSCPYRVSDHNKLPGYLSETPF